MMIPRLKLALLICAAISAAALGLALGSEYWGGLVPCPLCLLERWPYRIAAPLALFGAVLPRVWARLVLILCILVLLAGVGLGVVHVGVEAHWWPSPLPECAAPRLEGLSIAERLKRMPATPQVDCSEGTYLIPGLPISMAAMNLILALALAGGLATFWARTRRSPP
jgi:disulfide bond formation protein DsbB